jgi:hypothetical protein
MRVLLSLIVVSTLGIVLFSVGSVSAYDEDPADTPVEVPDETDSEDSEFEDGDTGIIDDCEGELYSTPEAAAEAAATKGMDFHEHLKNGTTYYMLHHPEHA